MVHMVLHLSNMPVERDDEGFITDIFPKNKTEASNILRESSVFLEVDKQSVPRY